MKDVYMSNKENAFSVIIKDDLVRSFYYDRYDEKFCTFVENIKLKNSKYYHIPNDKECHEFVEMIFKLTLFHD